MNIGNYYISKRQIIFFIILFAGLITSVYLVLNRQIFRSRAVLINHPFSIIQNTNPQQPATCSGESCTTTTLNVIIKSNLVNEPQNPTLAQLTPPVRNTNLAACNFYRNGVGQKFNNSVMPTLIADVAGRVGIPASALAGILRIESPEPFGSSDNNYVNNDYDAHSSGIAYGLMQFVPSTFESVFNSNRVEMQNSFGKTAVQTGIELQRYPAPRDNILRITSIRDSLIATAFKIRADARSNPPYDRQAVSNILSSYFGSNCSYQGGGADYCSDMLKGMSECSGI